MGPAATYTYSTLFVLTCAILAFTGYTDVRRRMINSFIFIPVVAVGAAANVMTGVPAYFIAIGIFIFLATYLETDLVIYPVIGMVFIALSLYFIITGGVYYGFSLLVISMVFLIGFQERLFGIGDVKAMVALFYSFTTFPFLTSATSGQLRLVQAMPLSLIMLFNIAIASLFFIPYVVMLNRKKGQTLGLHSVSSLTYDEKAYRGNEAKFNLRDTPGGKRMVYKTPFMISVGIGFLVTVLAGAWFVYL